MCSITVWIPWADECAVTLSIYILWFSDVYVSNVVFVIPRPGNFLPWRTCQSLVLGTSPLPYSARAPTLHSICKVTAGAAERPGPVWGVHDPAAGWILSSSLFSSPGFSGSSPDPSTSSSLLIWLQRTVLSFPGLRAKFIKFHPLLLNIFLQLFLFLFPFPSTGTEASWE